MLCNVMYCYVMSCYVLLCMYVYIPYMHACIHVYTVYIYIYMYFICTYVSMAYHSEHGLLCLKVSGHHWRAKDRGWIRISPWSHFQVRKLLTVPEGKSHEIPLNHHFPMVFRWFSYGFPMVFPWFWGRIFLNLASGWPRSSKPGIFVLGLNHPRKRWRISQMVYKLINTMDNLYKHTLYM